MIFLRRSQDDFGNISGKSRRSEISLFTISVAVYYITSTSEFLITIDCIQLSDHTMSHRIKPRAPKRGGTREVGWQSTSSRSNVTRIVDIPSERVSGSSISTGPGKRARIGESPERSEMNIHEEPTQTQYQEDAPRARRQTAVGNKS